MPAPLDEALKNLGQLFITGFNGLELSDDTSAFLSQAGIGGVILFAANYESPAQVAELCNQIQESRGDYPLWISVDHEGGRVQRFRKGFTEIPSAAAISVMDSPKLTFEIGEIMAKELKAVGINLNYAPCTDILTNPKNPVIGNRSFGATEEATSKMTSAIVRGHSVQGVQSCVKHFPGHGDTTVDSHFALPTVNTPLATLLDREFKPFTKAFKSHCNFVMTAHIINRELDPDRPATLSSKILRDLLRKQLRYSRIIVSDDMEMKAITDHFGAEDAPRLAIEAGCDALIYRTEAGARHAYESLRKALVDGALKPELVLEAAARLIEVKREFLNPYHPVVISEVTKVVGAPEHREVMARVKPLSG